MKRLEIPEDEIPKMEEKLKRMTLKEIQQWCDETDYFFMKGQRKSQIVHHIVDSMKMPHFWNKIINKK